MMMVAAMTLTGCGSSEEERVVNVCSWGEYIDETLIDQFEEETGNHCQLCHRREQ